MKRKLICALHFQPVERTKVITAGNACGHAVISAAAKYPTPPTSGADILDATETLEELDSKAKHGSELDTSLANEQSVLVYNMLHDNMAYIDSIAKGKESDIRLAGYDPIEEPAPHAAPIAPVIDRVADGTEEHSAKIFMASCEPHAMHIVETRDIEPTDPTKTGAWRFALQSTNSHNLVLKNLARAKEFELRVTDQNAAGLGTPGNPVRFLPR